MRTGSAIAVAKATGIARPLGRDTDRLVGDVLTSISRVLWPAKTAAHVAAVSGCTERAAERYLAGDREWSGDAVAAIVTEVLRRHSMRNFKVEARQ